jgi:hypothetical protein
MRITYTCVMRKSHEFAYLQFNFLEINYSGGQPFPLSVRDI